MSKKEELHHAPDARFQSGNRVYKVVVLGQGGVGKSGKTTYSFLSLENDPPFSRLHNLRIRALLRTVKFY